MNREIFRNSSLVENLGWTLVHSIWQIGLIALVLFFALRFLKKSPANTRYLLAVSAMILTLILPLATFFQSEYTSRQSRPANKTFKHEKLNSINERARMPEFSQAATETDLQTANPPAEIDFFSFENLRKSFTSNLASVLPMIVLLWMLGVGASAFRLFGGVWQLHKYKTREVSAPDAAWQKRFANLREKLQIVQTVRLLQSNLIKTPVVVGWLKPVILIPASVFLQISPAELETILAHELLHIRRLDNLVNFAQSFAEILFFYHPCGWWISGVVRREREFACDAAVLETLDSPRFVYANALANLEEIRSRAQQSLPSSLATAATGGKLMQRIEKILEKNAGSGENSKQTLWSAGCLAFLIVSAVLINVFWAGTAASVNAQAASKSGNKKIAVGFVSIPSFDRVSSRLNGADANNRLMMEQLSETLNMISLIPKLIKNKIPAIGFVEGGMISDGEKLYPLRVKLLRAWRDNNLEIGIGGYRHIWFYDTPYEDYVAGVEKTEQIVKPILAEKNLPLKYFSYPYLNTGKTAEDKSRFESWLGERGLTSVKYTIDNQEWMYSYAYDEARLYKNTDAMREIRRQFLDYMSKMFDYYEAYSADMFGRDINQTMVLTTSRLVSDSADELFGMIKNRGYQFVSMDEAQSDTAYDTPENFAGVKAGIPWFERWQLARDKSLRDEPRVDKSVSDVWDARNDKKPLPPKPPPPPAPPVNNML